MLLRRKFPSESRRPWIRTHGCTVKSGMRRIQRARSLYSARLRENLCRGLDLLSQTHALGNPDVYRAALRNHFYLACRRHKWSPSVVALHVKGMLTMLQCRPGGTHTVFEVSQGPANRLTPQQFECRIGL